MAEFLDRLSTTMRADPGLTREQEPEYGPSQPVPEHHAYEPYAWADRATETRDRAAKNSGQRNEAKTWVLKAVTLNSDPSDAAWRLVEGGKMHGTVQTQRQNIVSTKARDLCRLLRHTGPCRMTDAGKHSTSKTIPMDSGGWVCVSKVSRLLGLDLNEIVHIVRADSKTRFQLLKASWGRPDVPTEPVISWIAGIRAVASHSIPWLNPKRNLIPLTDELARYTSCAVHGTQKALIGDILTRGLITGGPDGTRNFTHLTPHAPWSSEYRHGKRQSDTYIFVDLVKLRQAQTVWVSPQGVLMCAENIPWTMMQCVMHRKRDQWLILWHKDLVHSEPMPGSIQHDATTSSIKCAMCDAKLVLGYVECPSCAHQIQYADINQAPAPLPSPETANAPTVRRDLAGDYSGHSSPAADCLKGLRRMVQRTAKWDTDPAYRQRNAERGWTRHFNFRCTEPWRPDSPDDLPVQPVHLSSSCARQVLLFSLMLGGVYAADKTHETRRRLVEAILGLPVDQHVRLVTLMTQTAPCDLFGMFLSFTQHAPASDMQESASTSRLPQTANLELNQVLGEARRYLQELTQAYDGFAQGYQQNRPREPQPRAAIADELSRSNTRLAATPRSVAQAGVASGVMPGATSARAVTRSGWRPSLWQT